MAAWWSGRDVRRRLASVLLVSLVLAADLGSFVLRASAERTTKEMARERGSKFKVLLLANSGDAQNWPPGQALELTLPPPRSIYLHAPSYLPSKLTR